MEGEIIKTVLNEVLQEFMEIKQLQAETLKILYEMKDNVAGLEEKYTGLKVARTETNSEQISFAISSGLNKIKDLIDRQTKKYNKAVKNSIFSSA